METEQITLAALKETDGIVVATGNKGKVKEIKAILGPLLPGCDFYALSEIALDEYVEPEENGETFAQNALIKAKTAQERLGVTAIADDSGLCVDALDGAPGIFSARWAGAHGDDHANNVKLLDELAKRVARTPEERKAHFVSSVALVFADGTVLTGEGTCEGSIAMQEAGSNGFGYDPIFLADALGGEMTTAQISAAEKNQISHRSKALRELAGALQEFLTNKR